MELNQWPWALVLMVEDKKWMASTRCNVGSWLMAFLQSWFTSGKDQVKLTFSNFKVRNGNTAFYSLWHPALLFLNFEPVLSALRLLSSELQCNKERRCAWLHGQPRRPSAGYKSENTSFYSSVSPADVSADKLLIYSTSGVMLLCATLTHGLRAAHISAALFLSAIQLHCSSGV